MFSLGEVKTGAIVLFRDEPHEVVKADHCVRGRGGAVLNTKLKNLKTGNVISQTFLGDATLEEADLEHVKAQYTYAEGNTYYFMDSETFEQFGLSAAQLGNDIKYLKEGTEVEALKFAGSYIKLSLPIKMVFEVVSAPPCIRGDTAQGGGSKAVEIETGAKITTPLFIKLGDKIRVDTRDGGYVERV